MDLPKLSEKTRLRKAYKTKEKKLGRQLSQREKIEIRLQMRVIFEKEKKEAVKNATPSCYKPTYDDHSPSFSWSNNHYFNHY